MGPSIKYPGSTRKMPQHIAGKNATVFGRQALLDQVKAAAELVTALRHIEDRGRNIVTALAADGPFVELRHYPAGDVRDPASHAQYFMHAHRRNREAAHIHCFMRAAGIPKAMARVEHRNAAARRRTMTHVLAVSLDHVGRPAGLFTTNKWVTAGDWYDAEALIGLLPHMNWAKAKGPTQVNRALGALFRLYWQPIEKLLRRRDRRLAAWAKSHPGLDIFEDRRLEVLSSARLNLEKTLARLRESLYD